MRNVAFRAKQANTEYIFNDDSQSLQLRIRLPRKISDQHLGVFRSSCLRSKRDFDLANQFSLDRS